MKDLVISGELLQNAKMTHSELLVEIAAYLYQKKKFTMGQAKKLAGLDQISFQKELARRDIFIHYEMDDVKKDAKNLGIDLK